MTTNKTTQTVLVLGASGMLGHIVFRYFSESPGYSAVGAVRSGRALELLPKELRSRVVCGAELTNVDDLLQLFEKFRPNIVINCVGLVKQLAVAGDPVAALAMNSMLPHRLSRLCKLAAARLVHVSTDCVFAGSKGLYREDDIADASDLYGRSKLLGEVDDVHAVTLRTSIIGPELDGAHGLLGWFLSQRGSVKGFTRAIFSGVPTVELARAIRDFVIPNTSLRGVYHVASSPISKYDLLILLAQAYAIPIRIDPDDKLVVDRSLSPQRFRESTGYVSPPWPRLIEIMREFG